MLSQIKLRKKLNFFNAIFDTAKEVKTYIDLTGRFSNQSSRGHNYIFLTYNYDSNTILVKAIPNREIDTIISAWKSIHYRLQQHGIIITRYILDNEYSSAFKISLSQEKLTFELVPPNQYQQNTAGVIRMFNNHLLSGLATCNPAFPLREWD